MARNNYARLAASRLAEYGARTGQPVYNGGLPEAGALHLSSEMGVKRLRAFAGEGYSVHDLGAASLTWEGLYLLLDGMCLAEQLRSDREAAGEPDG